jgi:outer membrane lipoprotein-sorting protein
MCAADLQPVKVAPSFEQMATSRVADLEASVNVLKADQDELKKIGKDFGLAYRLKNIVMWFKKPSKLRMEGKIGQQAALYIVNGATRFYSIPAIRLQKKDDLGAAAGKKYSLIEVGLISRMELASASGKYLRDEDVEGAHSHVFEVTYRGDNTTRYVVWIDPRTHVIRKREWYDGSGKLKAVFNYREVKEVSEGIWVPTKIEILNSDGVLAGVTTYSGLKVNQDLEDSLFQIS